MRIIQNCLVTTMLTAVSFVGLPSWAAAETAAVEGSAQTASAPIDDIVVTARRRKENLQDAPVAITALTSAALESRSVQDAVGLSSFVPNLNATKGFAGGSYANFFIRGVGQADQVIGVDPGVALYIDGVYLGRANGADIATLDLDRIEVLRGPQGTLFGKNTLGGAINIFTKAPTNELSGSAKVIAGSRNHAELRGWLNVPIVNDTLLARVSVNAKTQDGYGTRLPDGHRLGDVRSLSTRGHLLYTPNDTLSIDLQGDYLRSRGTGTMVQLGGVGTLGAVPANYSQFIAPPKSYSTYANYDPGSSLNIWGTSVTASLDIGSGITAKSITAYRALRQKTGNDFDGGPQSVIDQGFNTRQHQFSQELQLGGTSFDDRLNWVVGGYYFRESADQSVPLFVYSPTALNQVTLLDIKNLSAFAQASFKLNDWLSVTGGARYTNEKKDQRSTSFFLSTYDAFYDLSIDQLIDTPAQFRGLVTQPLTQFRKSWNSFTPKLSLEAKLSPDILAYASWSKGFKSGGFNSREAPTSDFSSYEPEKLTTYEIGVKSELFDRRLRLNLAGFYSDYQNVQLLVLRLTPEGAPQIATQNAAKARIYGLEAEAVLRLTPAFELNTALGYMNNKYLELTPGAQSAGIDLTDPLPQAPDWTINVGAQYQWFLPEDAKVTYRIDYSYKSEFYFFAASNAMDIQKPFSLVNMRLTFDSGKNWNAALFSNNVFNKYYYQLREDIRASYDIALNWPAEPRTFGMEFTYKF